jgi:hypothetical protein
VAMIQNLGVSPVALGNRRSRSRAAAEKLGNPDYARLAEYGFGLCLLYNRDCSVTVAKTLMDEAAQREMTTGDRQHINRLWRSLTPQEQNDWEQVFQAVCEENGASFICR